MIRKLRLKIVGISLVTVAAVLLSALVVLALSTRSQMVHSSEEHLAAALEGNADKNQLPGSSGQPCFVAEVFTGGTIRLSGSSYYNLENQDLVLDIVRSALEEKNDSGVLKDYSLRYMRRVGVVSVRIAFTDCSMERATMRSLLLRGGLVTLTALLVLTGRSYWLAGFAVRPVRRAWQEQKQFVSDASHELKTPLTAISGYAELIENGMISSDDEIRRMAGEIHNNSGRLITLINDVIRLSELDEEQDEILEKVPLSVVAQSSVKMLQINAEKHHVTLTFEGEDAFIWGTRQMVDEVVYNLCDNAIRYNKENGSVTVRVYRENGRAVLQVQDTGIGIPQECQERIFERFYRVDKGRSKLTGGTGLGLAIVKHILMRLKGELKLVSTPGQGTIITITFPSCKEDTDR